MCLAAFFFSLSPDTARVAAHTLPQQQPQPQGSATREHAALHAARTARTRHTHSTAARRGAAELQAPRTNDDARRQKDAACPQGHKTGDADRWGT